MGEFADDAIDDAIENWLREDKDEEGEDFYGLSPIQTVYVNPHTEWKTSNGTVLKFKNMNLIHLENIIKYLMKTNPNHESLKYAKHNFSRRVNKIISR